MSRDSRAAPARQLSTLPVRGASSDRRLYSTLPFDKLLSLGGRSEEISQICVVWGKAVALCRCHLLPPLIATDIFRFDSNPPRIVEPNAQSTAARWDFSQGASL